MRRFVALFFALALAYNMHAQDIIVLYDATEIEAKVVDVGQSVVVYKKWNSTDDKLIAIEKSKVFYVKREDGRKDYLLNNSATMPTTTLLPTTKREEPKKRAVKGVELQGYTSSGLVFMHSNLYGLGAGPILDFSLGADLYERVYIGATIGLYSMFASKYVDGVKIKSSEVVIPIVPLAVKCYLPMEEIVNPFLELSVGGFVLHSRVSVESYSVAATVGGLFLQAGFGFNVKMFSCSIGYTGLCRKGNFAHLGHLKLGVCFW
jgi:hypothetical protein